MTHKRVKLALKDQTGFEGRCDAILFAEPDAPAPAADHRPARKTVIQDAGRYDLVVVGGGMAGAAAAIRAARSGLEVALVQNRGVLGGNNSSQIRVPMQGKTMQPPFPRLGAVVADIAVPG